MYLVRVLRNIKKEWLYGLAVAGLIIIYVSGLFIDLMDIDATQYGSMSLEMLRNGHWLQVKDHLHDYLDKPPLLFWLSAISFKIFGVANWSYKIPSLVFSVISIYSTYRFAKLYYSEQTARLSALLLASCQAMVLFNNDVRTDALLTGSVMFAVWQLAEYLRSGKWLNAISAGVGIGLALLSKGPIGLMVPVLGFGADWISKRQWRNFFNPAWLVVFAVVAIVLSPMLYGLYMQHSWHGWYFFFWSQSFGRLTGQNDFVNTQTQPDTDPFFFVHTFLWSFLPWCILFILGYWQAWKSFFINRWRTAGNEEIITLAGFTLTFLGLSLSAYKLPYYIYVIFPFAAIMAARVFGSQSLSVGFSKVIRITGIIIGLVMLMAAWLLCTYVFPSEKVWLFVLLSLFTVLCFFGAWCSEQVERNILPALMGFIAFNIALNTQGYPSLLQYQSTSQVGKIVYANHIPQGQFRLFKTSTSALDFYSQQMPPPIYFEQLEGAAAKHQWIYTDKDGLQDVRSKHLRVAEVDSFANYRVTKLSLGFLNPKERAEHIDVRYLIKF